MLTENTGTLHVYKTFADCVSNQYTHFAMSDIKKNSVNSYDLILKALATLHIQKDKRLDSPKQNNGLFFWFLELFFTGWKHCSMIEKISSK